MPSWLGGSPATAAVMLGILFVYAAGVVVSGGHVLALSGYTLRYWGATNGYLITSGEWWRVVSSNFVHHDLLHLGFNGMALVQAARFVEHYFGGARLLFMFVFTGIFGMTASHLYYTFVAHSPGVTSAGASAAVCGLIGVALVAGHRDGTEFGRSVRGHMIRWIVMLAVMGLAAGFVNNAAHGGGFVGGLALGAVWPTLPRRAKAAYGLAAASLLLVVGSFVAALSVAESPPSHYPEAPRFFFGKLVDGRPDYLNSPEGWDLAERCEAATQNPQDDSALSACRELVYLEPRLTPAWWQLVAVYTARGERERAERAERAANLKED
jgi:rhomboid protease GluP